MAVTVPFPRLCNPDLSTKSLLHPVSMPLQLELNGVSTATIVLNPDEEAGIHDWVEIFTPYGSAGYFRVTATSKTPYSEVQLSLSHGLDVLSDAIVTTDQEITGSVSQVLQQLLSYQVATIGGVPCWTLGTCEDMATYTAATSYTSIRDCLNALLEHEPGYMLTYNMDVFPWEINLVARPAVPVCECRLSRNIETITITLDDADLCTRLVLGVDVHTSDEDGNDTTETIYQTFDDTAAQALYGIVTKSESIDSAVENPQAYAQKYFNLYNHPTVQIEISALELARYTGMGMDQLILGNICRVALVDLGGTWHEQIVAASYQDLMGQPERVKLSLSTTKRLVTDKYKEMRQTVERTESVASETKKSVRNQNTQLKKTYKEATAAYSKINNVEISLDEVNAQIKLKADSTYTTALEQRLTSAEILIDGQQAQIDLKAGADQVHKLADDMEGVVKRVSNAEIKVDGLEGTIDLKADVSTVTQLRNDVTGIETRVSQAEINIDGANAAIDLKADQTTVTTIQGDLASVTERVSAAEINIDGANAAIQLKADQSTVTKMQDDLGNVTQRITNAEIDIDGANANIALKANATTVNELGERVSAAEIDIDGLNSEIDLKADTITLQGYVTANQLQTELANIKQSFSREIYSDDAHIQNLHVSGSIIMGQDDDTHFYIRNIRMGNVCTGAQVLSSVNGIIDLTHYHTLSCDSSGVVTLGAVTTDASEATFNMAATAYFKNAVAAAKVDAKAEFKEAIENGEVTAVLTPSASGTLSTDAVTIKDEEGVTLIANVPANFDVTAIYQKGLQDGQDGSSGTMIDGPILYNIEEDTTNHTVSFDIGYKLNGQQSMTYVPKTITITDIYDAAYAAGETAGEGNVTITSVTGGNAYYSTETHETTVPLSAAASNGATGVGSVKVSGERAYNAGLADGAASAVGSMVSGPTLYNVEQDTTGKKVTFDVGYQLNGQTTMQYVAKEVPAGDIYDAGHAAGYDAGEDSVTITSVTGGNAYYSTETGEFTVPLSAVASNGATGVGSVKVSGERAYNAGLADGAASAVGSMVSGPTLYNVSQDADTKKVTFDIGYQLNGQTAMQYVSKEVSAADIYTAAYNAGYTAGGNAAVGRMVSGPTLYNIVRDSDAKKVTFDIGYKLNGQSTFTYVSKEINVSGIYTDGYNAGHTAGYSSGYNAGEDAVEIDSVSGGTPAYNSSSNAYTIPLTAVASNGARGTGEISFTATDAYNAGASSVGFAEGPSIVNVVEDSEYNRVSFDVVYRLTNQASTTTLHRTVTTPTIYNRGYRAGYDSGEAAGERSVTVSSVTGGTQRYDSSSHNTTVEVTGTASNGATKTSSITVSGSSAYSAGESAGYTTGYNYGLQKGKTEGANAITISSVDYTTYYLQEEDTDVLVFDITLSNGAHKSYEINMNDMMIPEGGGSGGGGSSTQVDFNVSVDTHSLSVERSGSAPYWTYTVKSQAIAKVTLSDGRSGSKADWQYFDASSIYADGYNAGRQAGQSGATIHAVTISNPVYHDEYYYKLINFDVTVEMTDGSTVSYTKNVSALDAYNAGKSAGDTEGYNRGRSSVYVDTDSIQISGDPRYYKNSQTFYFDVYAETSAGDGRTASGISINAHEAWVHGYKDGSGYVRAEVTRMSCEFDSSTGEYEYMVYLKLYDLGGQCADRAQSISWVTKTRL